MLATNRRRICGGRTELASFYETGFYHSEPAAMLRLAMHMVAELQIGVPQSSREAFDLLFQQGIISEQLSRNLKAKVGFRNIAVQDYQSLQIEILKAILSKHLVDFTDFSDVLKKHANTSRN